MKPSVLIPVLQVSGPGTAVQLQPAGHAQTEATHVQRTVPLPALAVMSVRDSSVPRLQAEPYYKKLFHLCQSNQRLYTEDDWSLTMPISPIHMFGYFNFFLVFFFFI